MSLITPGQIAHNAYYESEVDWEDADKETWEQVAEDVIRFSNSTTLEQQKWFS
jgi:hypothetical protein